MLFFLQRKRKLETLWERYELEDNEVKSQRFYYMYKEGFILAVFCLCVLCYTL